jgi:hypothetical protein
VASEEVEEKWEGKRPCFKTSAKAHWGSKTRKRLDI